MAKQLVCKYEGKIATLSNDVKYLRKYLEGNGIKGLIPEFRDFKEEINKNLNTLKNYNHLKNWIMGGVVTVLISLLSILLTYLRMNGG